VEDPEPLLFHGEPLWRGGKRVGHLRAAAYGHTLGGAVGLAIIEDEAGLPVDAVDGSGYEVDIAGARYPARVSVKPMYDPERRRILA
jgi:4-methylaminobutanoate oxidase (formaldehyde-forming)